MPISEILIFFEIPYNGNIEENHTPVQADSNYILDNAVRLFLHRSHRNVT